jgi:hypothetical protein
MLFERLLQDLKAEQSKLERLIVQGQISDYAKYKFLVGKAQGLLTAIDILREVFKRYDDAESRK